MKKEGGFLNMNEEDLRCGHCRYNEFIIYAEYVECINCGARHNLNTPIDIKRLNRLHRMHMQEQKVEEARIRLEKNLEELNTIKEELEEK